MGKNTNQIATFNDLQSIGYRIPSAITDLNHCVTYGDFASLDDINNITFSYNSSLTNKLIKWSDIPGTSGQTIGSTYTYTVPIKIDALNNTGHSLNGITYGTVSLGWRVRNSNGTYTGNTLVSGTLKFGTTLTLNVPINLIPNTSGQILLFAVTFTKTLSGAYNGSINSNLTYILNNNTENLAGNIDNTGETANWIFYTDANGNNYLNYNQLISVLTNLKITFY